MDIDIRINKPHQSNNNSKYPTSSLTPMTEVHQHNEVDSNDLSHSRGNQAQNRQPTFKFPDTNTGIDTSESEATKTFYNSSTPDHLLENRQMTGDNFLQQDLPNENTFSSIKMTSINMNINQGSHQNYHMIKPTYYKMPQDVN